MLSFFRHQSAHQLPDLLRVALQSRSGYEREAALKQLRLAAAPPDVVTLRLVLLRLNDWVGPVRAEAEATLDRWLPAISARDLLDCVDELEALERGRRSDGRCLARLHAHLLRGNDPEATARLSALMLNPKRAQFAWRSLRKLGALPDADLLMLGLRSGSPKVQIEAAKGLNRLLVQPALWLAALQLALTQRQSGVRAQALRSVPADWRQALPPDVAAALAPLLRHALLDPGATVRFLAVAHWGEAAASLSQWAVAQLPQLSAREQAVALQLLADLGQTAAQDTVRAAFDAPTQAVRQSALLAALRMGMFTPAQALAHSLDDPAPGVYVRVLRWCKRSRLSPSRGELRDAGLLDDEWRPLRPDLRVLDLLAQVDHWAACIALLQGVEAPRIDEAERWLLHYNASSMRPTARQWADIQALLASGKTGVFASKPSALRTLRFVLDTMPGMARA